MDIVKPNTIANTAEFSRASTARYRSRAGLLSSAAINVARFHYRGEDEACVLLVEAAGTNTALQSEVLSDAAWVKAALTVTDNAATDPAGTTLADKLVETAVVSAHTISQSVGQPDSTPLTASMWFKAAERDKVVLSLLNKANVEYGAIFDLTLGTVAAQPGMTAPITMAIEKWGAGWYRCAVSGNSGTGATTPRMRAYLANAAGATSYQGVAATGLHGFGGQLEAVAKITSYIPTTSGTASRSADTIPAGCKFVSNLPENDYAAHAMGTLYSTGDRVISTATHKIYEALRGNKGTVTITVAAPGVVSYTSHGFPANRKVRFTSTGALPTPLAAGTDYYVVAANLTPDTFSVSATPGGAAISVTSTGSGVFTCYDARNIGIDPTAAANTVRGDTSGITDTVYWLEIGATNRWRMFDNSASGQSSQAGALEFAIVPGQITLLGLVNISATKGSATLYDPAEGLVMYRSFGLREENVFDWLQYFIAPSTLKTDYVVDNVPSYINAFLTVSLSNASGNALCGEVIAGIKQSTGRAQWGAKPGITSFGKKETDAYGSRFLKPGNFQKRLTVDVFVENNYADEANRLMTIYRETPLLWIGDKNKTSTIVYGFYNDYDLVLQSIAGSFMTAEIEGL